MPQNECDYCNATVDPATNICRGCGYDYTDLVESGEYHFEPETVEADPVDLQDDANGAY